MLSVPRYGIYPAFGRPAGEFLLQLWDTACAALRLPAEQATLSAAVLRRLLPDWAGERIESRPATPSFVAADGFPAELSVNWSGVNPELRVLFDHMSDVQYGQEYGPWLVSMRFQLVHDVFTPRAGRSVAAPVWHSMAWRAPDQLIHKAYFGLYRWPHAEREVAVRQAMARLGLATAWDNTRALVARAGGRRELEFIALDLSDTAGARVKVYYRNHDAELGQVNQVAAVAREHDQARALAAYRMLAGARADAGAGALTCLAFRAGLDRADEATTYLRMSSLTGTDQQAVDRTAALLRREQVDPRRFEALAAALAPGPLANSTGVLELVSHRAARRAGDVTTYFRFSVYDQPAPVDAPVDDPAYG